VKLNPTIVAAIDRDQEQCRICHGTGEVLRGGNPRQGPGIDPQDVDPVPCNGCGGTGADFRVCPKCHMTTPCDCEE